MVEAMSKRRKKPAPPVVVEPPPETLQDFKKRMLEESRIEANALFEAQRVAERGKTP